MQIKFTSILVDDQSKALAFYTEVLGFRKFSDIPMGEYRWLTVVSPDGVAGAEVVLEPMAFPPARTWQKALFEAGIPATAFITNDIDAELLIAFGERNCRIRTQRVRDLRLIHALRRAHEQREGVRVKDGALRYEQRELHSRIDE